jgi:hypothetical protein
MSQLAYNAEGIRFTPPPATAAWRVRRCKKNKKGAPELVFGEDGTPLAIERDATIEELRAEVSEPGKYRLDAIDEEQRPIPDATPAYVMIHETTVPNGEAKSVSSSSVDTMASILTEVLRSNIEANRANLALGQTIVDRFAGVMESAAVLVRAVGGIPPAPAPVAGTDVAVLVEADEAEDGEQAAPAQGLDLNALVAQVVTSVVTAVCNGQMKLPTLGSLLDWRRAAPAASASVSPEPAPTSAPSDTTTRTAASSTPATAGRSAGAPTGASSESPIVPSSALTLAALSPAAMGQLMAVQQALAPDERTLALAVIRELPPSELQVWAQELTKLPLESAVAKIREVLHRPPAEPTGGAS